MRHALIALAAAALALAPARAQPAPMTDDAVLERGRTLTARFYAVDLDPVWAAFSERLRGLVGGLEAFRAYRVRGVQDFGAELKLYDEGVVAQDGLKYYVRAASFEKRPDLVWYVIFGFDPDSGAVEYFNIEYAGQAPTG